MAQLAQVAQCVKHRLRTHDAERVDGDKRVGGVLGAIYRIVGQAGEILALVGLVVLAAPLHTIHPFAPCVGRDGGLVEQFLIESHCGGHVLGEAADGDVGAACAGVDAVAAGQVVEGAAYLLRSHVGRACQRQHV